MCFYWSISTYSRFSCLAHSPNFSSCSVRILGGTVGHLFRSYYPCLSFKWSWDVMGIFSGLNEENNVFMTQIWNLEPFNIRIEVADVHVGPFKKFVNLHHQLRIIELHCAPFQCHRFPWWPSFKKRRNAKECGKLVSTYWDRPLSTYVPWHFEGGIWVASQFSKHRLVDYVSFPASFLEILHVLLISHFGVEVLKLCWCPMISFVSCLFKWFLKRSGQNESKEHAFRKFGVICRRAGGRLKPTRSMSNSR